MATVTNGAEFDATADDGIITVGQFFDSRYPGLFAVSDPGVINLAAGSQFAHARIRLERWDSAPPDVSTDWEERDLLPWQTSVGHPSTVILWKGPDPACEAGGLSVAGLGAAQVRVAARGRHAIVPATDETEERWLVQIWPATDASDVMAGPPRILARRSPFPVGDVPDPRDALQAWQAGGWVGWLDRLPAFHEIKVVLSRGAATRGALGEHLSRFLVAPGESGPSDPWSVPVTGELAMPLATRESARERYGKLAQNLADVARVPEIITTGQLVEALLSLGLLTELNSDQTESRLALAIPRAPLHEIEQADLIPATERQSAKSHGMQTQGRAYSPDLEQAARWADAGLLESSVEEAARRWSTTPDAILAALALLALKGYSIHPPAHETVSNGRFTLKKR